MRAALLTPVAKAYSTDIGVEVASLGVKTEETVNIRLYPSGVEGRRQMPAYDFTDDEIRNLAEFMRWVDQIARWEDHLFLLVLPETGEEEATTLFNDILAEKHKIDLPEAQKAAIDLRFGLAEWKKGINASDLLMRCEDDMHDRMQASDNGQDVA